MKIRILSLLLTFAIICISLASCEGLKLANNILGIVNPDEGDTTNNLQINFAVPDPNRCTTHAIVPLSAIAPTCSTPGVSGGQVCQNCGVVIVAQVELPVLDHVYDNQEDSTCNECGYIREIRCEHLATKKLAAKNATCTSTGRTAGEQCIGCGKIIAGYEIIQPTPHVYDSDTDTTCNGCNYVRKIECTHEVTNKLLGNDSTCTQTGLTDGLICVHCGEILVAQKVINLKDHTESEWIVDKAPTELENGEKHTVCTVCNATLRVGEIDKIIPETDESASEGLTFVMNEDRNSYILIDIGTCTDTEIVIPRYYNGKPVTKIAEGAFLNNASITSVTIPEGVLNIGNGAFRNCTALENIVIPSTVTSIGEYAFYGCTELHEVVLPEGITAIEKYTFYNCTWLFEINIPYGVTKIDDYAFYNCYGISSIVLPSSLETIGKYSFYSTDLTSITIPNGVRSIGDYAFCLSDWYWYYSTLYNEYRETRRENFYYDDYGYELQYKMIVTLFKGINKLGAYAFHKGSSINYKGSVNDWKEIIINPMNYNYKVTCTDGVLVR